MAKKKVNPPTGTTPRQTKKQPSRTVRKDKLPKDPKKVYGAEGIGYLLSQMTGKEYRTPADPPRGSLTEGREIGPAFTELIREGKAVRMLILMKLASFPGVGHSFPVDGHHSRGGSAVPLRNEFSEMISTFRRQGGAQQYGATYSRPSRIWYAHVPEPAQLDEDGEMVINHRLVQVAGPDAAEVPEAAFVSGGMAKFTADELILRWIEEFVAEVELCAQRFHDHADLRTEFERLISELDAFEPGSAQGRQFLEQWNRTAEGRELLAIMRTGKERLIRSLREVLDEQAPEPIAGMGPRITWRGRPGELADLFHQLAVNGWIEEPRKGKRAKLGRQLLAIFKDRDGNDFEESSFVKYIQPKADRHISDGWMLELSKLPDMEE
jgi:hypothetical protein